MELNDKLNLALDIVKKSKKAKNYNTICNNILNNLAKQELAYTKSVNDVGFYSDKANILHDKILYVKFLSKFIDKIGGLQEHKEMIMETYIKDVFSSKPKTEDNKDILTRLMRGIK